MVSKSRPLFQAMMRAVRISQFGGPEVCKVEQVDKPTVAPGQVLIKTQYAGINPVDTYIRSGTFARKPELPYTPGSDCSGMVEAVGEGVVNLKPGDAVFTVCTVSGSCAEYTVAESSFTFKLDTDNVTFAQGACLGVPYFTAYRALFMCAEAKQGETVLVHGASGGVGSVCVQIAKHSGMKVLATAGTDVGLQIIKDSGADLTYNHRDPGYEEKIKADVGEAGVNVIIEMLANVNLQRDLELLSQGGRVVVVGSRGNIEINPRFTMAKESRIIGCMLFASQPDEWKKMAEEVALHQKQGWLKPVVSTAKSYSLEKIAEAHENIMSSHGASGNLVIQTHQ